MVRIKIQPHKIIKNLNLVEIRSESGNLLATIIPREDNISVISKHYFKCKNEESMAMGIPNKYILKIDETKISKNKPEERRGIQFIGDLMNETNSGTLKSPLIYEDGQLDYEISNIRLLKFWCNFMHYQGKKRLTLKIY